MQERSGKRFERLGIYPVLLTAAGALLIFGSLTGWVRRGPATIPGFAGDGMITIISGIAILGIVILMVVGERKRLFAFSLASYGVGFIALFVAVYYLVGVARCSSGIEFTAAGAGLYVTLTGAAAAVIASLGNIAAVSRGDSTHPGHLEPRDRAIMLSLTLAAAAMVIAVFLSVGR